MYDWVNNCPGNRVRYMLVSEVVNAASGTVVFTQERGNKVVLKHTSDRSVFDESDKRLDRRDQRELHSTLRNRRCNG